MIWQSSLNVRNWLPRLQAHRGRWVDGEAENSLFAIKRAFDLNYQMCEFDVRMTADDVLILFHDAKFNNKFISDTLFKDMNHLGEITTLKEIFDWFVTTIHFKLNIEIKNDLVFNYKIEKRICALMAEYNISERVLISSFNPLTLAKVRLFNPSIYRALLLSFEATRGNNLFVMSGIMNFWCYPHILHLRYQDYLKNKMYYNKLSEKIPIVLWTLNDIRIYIENSQSLHGVISDDITPADFDEIKN